MLDYHLETNDDLGIFHLHASNANAMNERVLEAVATGLQEARDANLNGLILTGYDRFFSAGLDLIEVYQLDREQMRRFITNAEEMREKFLAIWFNPAARRGIEEMRNDLLTRQNTC